MFFSCINFCRAPRKLFDREVDVTYENILCTESDIVYAEDHIHSTPYPQHRSHHIHSSRVAQSVTCLATDAYLTADPGVASSIPARSHTFVEIDHEIISTVILLPSADSFKKGCCQLQAKVCAQITG